MATNPQYFFRFAADHYPLLVDLFYRTEGVNDIELLALVQRHRSDTDPSAHHVVDQLLKLSILETVPDATASYEMTRQVRTLLGFLLLEHRLTSAAVIQGYLNDLDQLGRELDDAVTAANGNQAARVLAEIGDLIERVRQDSRANREGIINEVMAVKSNRERRSVRERFEIINRLWSRYLEPLRDLIDVRKSMDHTLDGLERLVRDGLAAFALDGALSRELTRTRARLLRLRRAAAADFRESVREIEPLYHALRRESEIVRGASRALESVRRHGLRSLNLVERFALPAWRREGLFADGAVAAFLHDIHGYEPRKPPAIPAAAADEPQDFIDPEAMLATLAADLPVPDVLEWLVRHYGEASLGELLRAYGRVHGGEVGRVAFGPQEREYQVAGIRVAGHPLRVEPSSVSLA
jgi:hypothetical protein